MKLIAFETSTPSGGVALIDGPRLLGEAIVTNSREHSKRIMPLAETILQSAGLKWNDLAGVAVTCGPGSFVGVRVGLALAKGIAFANGIPLITVSTLEALAHHSWSGEPMTHVVPAIDARIGEVYAAVFRVEGEKLVREGEDFCAPAEELGARLPDDCLFSGEGAIKYYDEHLAKKGRLARLDRRLASPAAVAVLGARKLASGDVTPVSEAAAIYLREATTTQPKS